MQSACFILIGSLFNEALQIGFFFREHNILEGNLLCNDNQNMIQVLKNSVKFYEQPQSEDIILLVCTDNI